MSRPFALSRDGLSYDNTRARLRRRLSYLCTSAVNGGRGLPNMEYGHGVPPMSFTESTPRLLMVNVVGHMLVACGSIQHRIPRWWRAPRVSIEKFRYEYYLLSLTVHTRHPRAESTADERRLQWLACYRHFESTCCRSIQIPLFPRPFRPSPTSTHTLISLTETILTSKMQFSFQTVSSVMLAALAALPCHVGAVCSSGQMGSSHSSYARSTPPPY
jgi:hypothetical protein